jgi:hypothetical protein
LLFEVCLWVVPLETLDLPLIIRVVIVSSDEQLF